MLLENKNAIIYGAGGAVGGAIARVFALAGAKVFLTGHHLAKVDAVAHDISTTGGVAETAQVDALDEKAVEKHISGVEKEAGSIDISFNAIGIPQQGIQGIPLAQLSVDSFALPITTYSRAQFLTARAAARRMIAKRSGVILMHTPEPAFVWVLHWWAVWHRHGQRWKPFPDVCRQNLDHRASALFACDRPASPRQKLSIWSLAFTRRRWASVGSNFSRSWKARATDDA